MSTSDGMISRKTVLKAAAALGAAPLLVGGGVALARDQIDSGQPLGLTPECHDGDAPTVEQIEGPYFKPNSPLRSSMVNDGPGTHLVVSGYVFGRACQPISGVLLDFWQADNGGNYDNVTYTFRGHQFTDANGAYKLDTIVPGLYPGRTRHLHVKLQAPGRQIVTTQLYFPNEPRNSTDSIYDARLLMNVRQNGNTREASFDFVLNVAQTPGTPSPTPTPTATPTGGPSTPPPSGTWAAGTSYNAGDRVTYNGVSYTCLQAHTAMAGWEPPNVPALWQRS
ncbi:carbohydrate-binding protein [Kitasatospora sp. NPDC056783]|uniref:dioxygenase family protein n=1 Tax=Kitasatospora sp. NPDC056783 TaxID=3345943 RepID=UPI0036BE7792